MQLARELIVGHLKVGNLLTEFLHDLEVLRPQSALSLLPKLLFFLVISDFPIKLIDLRALVIEYAPQMLLGRVPLLDLLLKVLVNLIVLLRVYLTFPALIGLLLLKCRHYTFELQVRGTHALFLQVCFLAVPLDFFVCLLSHGR